MLDQESGSFISNAPRNEIANRTSNKKKMMLHTAFVASAFKPLGPKMAVTISPNAT